MFNSLEKGRLYLLLPVIMVTTSQYVQNMKYIGNHVNQWYRWLLVQRYFKGWHGYVRQQEVRMWEKERLAKVHYYWLVLPCVWIRLIF